MTISLRLQESPGNKPADAGEGNPAESGLARDRFLKTTGNNPKTRARGGVMGEECRRPDARYGEIGQELFRVGAG